MPLRSVAVFAALGIIALIPGPDEENPPPANPASSSLEPPGPTRAMKVIRARLEWPRMCAASATGQGRSAVSSARSAAVPAWSSRRWVGPNLQHRVSAGSRATQPVMSLIIPWLIISGRIIPGRGGPEPRFLQGAVLVSG